MSRTFITLLIGCSTLSVVAGESPASPTHLTREDAIMNAVTAMLYRSPGWAKTWTYDAKYHDGIWEVSRILPKRPNQSRGDRLAFADVRDSDGKPIKFYFTD